MANHAPGSFFVQLDVSGLERAINGHKQVQPALPSTNLRDVDVEIAKSRA